MAACGTFFAVAGDLASYMVRRGFFLEVYGAGVRGFGLLIVFDEPKGRNLIRIVF